MVDETKTILIIGIVAGGIGLLSGVFIIYAHYLKIKTPLQKGRFYPTVSTPGALWL